jgi:rhodanese-related sulfurtransferase
MNWSTVFIVAALVVVVLLLKKSSEISPEEAHGYLQKGAMVIDVRNPGEFHSGHLAAAINIPLDEIESALPRLVVDHDRVLLLHCQSGVRSAMAKSKAKDIGYSNVFNLGSFARAKSIVEN